MKKTSIVFASGAFLLSAAVSATAADFATTDTNGDGVVTLDEAQAAMPELTEDMFTSADADGSGSLSPQEFLTLAS
jgi:Ca2+-binding EF-hand superfamily protein